MVGEGAVTIRYREMRLAADRVVYNEVTREVVADGNVVLDSGPDRIQGEHLELNIETRVGFFERAQGFLQTYYFTGERLEKRGPDHYFLQRRLVHDLRGGPARLELPRHVDRLTVDEYLTRLEPDPADQEAARAVVPLRGLPDQARPLHRPADPDGQGHERPTVSRWATRSTGRRATTSTRPSGFDYLAKTGWGASGEMRYLLAPRTQGVVTAYYQRNTATDGVRWTLADPQLPGAAPRAARGRSTPSSRATGSSSGRRASTIEERSSTTSSFFINRNWAFLELRPLGPLRGEPARGERTTLTRFPELRIDRTSTRLFGTGIFLKVAASGAVLERDLSTSTISTTRLHLAPEVTWPLSIGSVARVVPDAPATRLTDYSENLEGEQETRALPYFKIGLEGPRPYRIWDLSPGGASRSSST